MMEKYLTPADVAEALSVSKGTLSNWRRDGGGPPFVQRDWVVRYPVSGLEKWLDAELRDVSS